MEIIKYIPHFLREVLEYKNISTIETGELQRVADDIDFVFKNQFIATAENYGLDRFENYVKSFSNSDDDLNTRRKKLLLMTLDNRPYTLKSTEDMLNTLFGNYGFELHLEGFRLTVKTSGAFKGDEKTIHTFLQNILPANIYYMLNFTENTHEDYANNTHYQLSSYTHEQLAKGLK